MDNPAEPNDTLLVTVRSYLIESVGMTLEDDDLRRSDSLLLSLLLQAQLGGLKCFDLEPLIGFDMPQRRTPSIQKWRENHESAGCWVIYDRVRFSVTSCNVWRCIQCTRGMHLKYLANARPKSRIHHLLFLRPLPVRLPACCSFVTSTA